jgi:hypothetical protein
VFVDRLRAVLTLIVGGSTFTFASGSFEELAVEAMPYGFEARATVFLSSELDTDELFPLFTSTEAIQATLTINSCVLEGSGEDSEPIKLVGLVVEKTLGEEVGEDVSGRPVVGRSYGVRFQDPASVLWKNHFPLELHTEVSMAEVIELHKLQGMEISYDWTRLSAKQDILMVASGADGGASFYDFVVGYIDRNGGHLELDAASGSYRIGEVKKRPSLPVEIEREYTAKLTALLPEPVRRQPRLLNGVAEGPQTTPVTNELAYTSVVGDVLLRTPIATQVEQRQRVEERKLKPGLVGLRIDFARCPPELVKPGMFLYLGDDFSDRLLTAKKVFRVCELHLQATATTPEGEEEPELEDTAAPFEMSLHVVLEHAMDTRQRLPRFAEMRLPVQVEGKIVSEGGGDKDRTWMMATDEANSLHRYIVQIPLWNKKIPAPFEPNHLPGQLFFPAYKHQRVLVGIFFDNAVVLRFLDWAENARTPLDGQGNRMALGHQASNGTVIDHIYQDSKPQFSILRTFGNDLQTLLIKDGTMYLEVREDESLDELEPTYDVTVVVSSSKERVAGEVRGAVEQVTGAFESSMGAATGRLDGAVEELTGAVDAAEASLSVKIEAVNAELEELASSLAAATAEVAAAVADAKAALLAMLR